MESLLVVVTVSVAAALGAWLSQVFFLRELVRPARLGLETPQLLQGRSYYILSELQYMRLQGAYLRELERACGRRSLPPS